MWKELRERARTHKHSPKKPKKPNRKLLHRNGAGADFGQHCWKHLKTLYTFFPLSLAHCVELKYTRMRSAAEAAQQPTEFTDYKMCVCTRIFLRQTKAMQKICGRRAHTHTQSRSKQQQQQQNGKKFLIFYLAEKQKLKKKYIYFSRSLQIKKFVSPLLGRYWRQPTDPLPMLSLSLCLTLTHGKQQGKFPLHSEFLLHCFARKRPSSSDQCGRQRGKCERRASERGRETTGTFIPLLAATSNIGLD